MKISIDSFGGNKDNYYNFKDNWNKASEHRRLAGLYVSPFFTDSTLGKVDNLLGDLMSIFDKIEFED
jgi:hypothetical protein